MIVGTASQGAAFAEERSSAQSGTPPVKIQATQQQGSSAPSSSEADAELSGNLTAGIEKITKKILLDEIELEEYNLIFRTQAARQGRWKGWRYFGSQETNLALSGAGSIVSVHERGEHIHDNHFARNSGDVLGNGNAMLGVIGQIVGGTGSGVELGINQFHAMQARANGFDPRQSRDVALHLLSSIDTKLAARARLVERQPAVDAETAELQRLEGAVLEDFRDLSIAEFERFHSSARKTLAQQNSFYLLDILKNSIGTTGSFYLAYGSISHARALNFPGGLLATISGAFIVANPVLSRLVAKAVSKSDKRELAREGMPPVYENDEHLEKDYTRLLSFTENHQLRQRHEFNSLMARLEAYDASHKYCLDTIERNLKDQIRGNRTAYQNMGAGFLVGSTKIASNVIITVAGAKYPRRGAQTNALLFTGAVVYLPGATYGLLDNIRIQVGSEIRRHRLSKQHQLSGQIVSARLQQLKQIKEKI